MQHEPRPQSLLPQTSDSAVPGRVARLRVRSSPSPFAAPPCSSSRVSPAQPCLRDCCCQFGLVEYQQSQGRAKAEAAQRKKARSPVCCFPTDVREPPWLERSASFPSKHRLRYGPCAFLISAVSDLRISGQFWQHGRAVPAVTYDAVITGLLGTLLRPLSASLSHARRPWGLATLAQ